VSAERPENGYAPIAITIERYAAAGRRVAIREPADRGLATHEQQPRTSRREDAVGASYFAARFRYAGSVSEESPRSTRGRLRRDADDDLPRIVRISSATVPGDAAPADSVRETRRLFE